MDRPSEPGHWRVKKSKGSELSRGAVVAIQFAESALLLTPEGFTPIAIPFRDATFVPYGRRNGSLRWDLKDVEIESLSDWTSADLRDAIWSRRPAEQPAEESAPTEPVEIRIYPGRTVADAAQLFQRDSARMAAFGYRPTAQSWGEGRPGIGRVVTLGLSSLAFRPNGFLTVTYLRFETASDGLAESGENKVCPDCAEVVLAAARICRFCRYQFIE